MRIADLAIGARICFGSYKVPARSVINDLVWIKVHPDNRFIAESFVRNLIADAPEPENKNRDRRERGSNFFPQTNILQWLNGIGNDWFVKQHVVDEAPNYAGNPGFLRWFEPWELDSLLPQEITVLVPNGFLREFGEKTTITRRVVLPSASEIGASDDTTEGVRFKASEEGLWSVSDGMLTRTASGASFIVGNYYEAPNRVIPANRAGICPLIRIKEDLLVGDESDENGCFVAMYPEELQNKLNEDLVTLLTR